MGELRLQSNFSTTELVSCDFNGTKVSYRYKCIPFMKEFLYRNSDNIRKYLEYANFRNINELYPNVYEWSFGYNISPSKSYLYEMTDNLKQFMNFSDWTFYKENVLNNMSRSFTELLGSCDLMYFYTLVGDTVTEKNREARYDQLLTGKQYLTNYRTISGTNKLRKLYYVLGSKSEFTLDVFSDSVKMIDVHDNLGFHLNLRKGIHRDFILDPKDNLLYIPIFLALKDEMVTIYVSNKPQNYLKHRYDIIFK